MKIYTVVVFFIFAGCKQTSYFSSSNDLLNKDCLITLLSGTTVKGKLTIQFETGNAARDFVELKTAGSAVEKIPVDSIKYYQLGRDYFFPKQIDLESFEIPVWYNLSLPNLRNILFVKRVTGEGASIELFELFISGRKTTDGFDHYDYFVSFVNHGRFEALGTRSNLFFPDFNEKMSGLIKDCLSLADKIKQKEKGYTLGQLSVDGRKNEVIKKIIFEYNDCKLKNQTALKIK